MGVMKQWVWLFLCAGLGFGSAAFADTAQQINERSQRALSALYELAPGSEKLIAKSAGVLVFPDQVMMGFGVGGQFGEGVLLVDEEPQAYYASAHTQYGLPEGALFKAEVIVFKTEDALDQFRATRSWKVGAEVSVKRLPVSEPIRYRRVKAERIGFVFSDLALLPQLPLDGSRITRLAR